MRKKLCESQNWHEIILDSTTCQMLTIKEQRLSRNLTSLKKTERSPRKWKMLTASNGQKKRVSVAQNNRNSFFLCIFNCISCSTRLTIVHGNNSGCMIYHPFITILKTRTFIIRIHILNKIGIA